MAKLKITKSESGNILIFAGDELLGLVTDFQLEFNATRPEFDIVLRQAVQSKPGEYKRHFLIGENLEMEVDVVKDHLKSLFKDS